MKKLLIIIFLFTMFNIANAQYSDAVGLRLGADTGLSYKHNFNEYNGIEAMVFRRWSGLGAAVLLEHQNGLGSSADFYWFYGYGAHVVSYDGKYISSGIGDGSFTAVGVDVCVGIEYMIPGVPFSASIDMRPAFDIIGRFGFASGGAFTLRYTF